MRFAVIALCILLVHGQVRAQAPAEPPPPVKIEILQGEGSINNVRKRTADEAAVRVVEEASGKPVSGASVTFILPTQGASGEFSNDSQSITIQTDNTGKAVARLKPNRITGRMEIRVNAVYRGQTARAVITQYNMDVPGAGGGSGKVIAILAIIGAAAAGGAIALTRNGSNGSSAGPGPAAPGPIVITPGTGTAGPPQ